MCKISTHILKRKTAKTNSCNHHLLRTPEQLSSRIDRGKASSPPGQIQTKLSWMAWKSSLISESWELTRMRHRKCQGEKEENSFTVPKKTTLDYSLISKTILFTEIEHIVPASFFRRKTLWHCTMLRREWDVS